MSDQLPVVNVASYLAGEPGSLEKLSSELYSAMAGIGFYYLEGYDALVPASLCEAMLDAAVAAHEAPSCVKEQWLLDDADSGFMPRGATTRWGSLGRPELPIHDGVNEAVLIWGHGPPWSRRQIGSSFRENKMPDDKALPGWADTVEAYYNGIRELATRLMPAYAVALRQAPEYFNGRFDEPCWCIRVNMYPAVSGEEQSIGIPPHADGDFATFLLTDDQPGLSLLKADGETWVHLKQGPREGAKFALLVNSGRIASTAQTRHLRGITHNGLDNYLCSGWESFQNNSNNPLLFSGLSLALILNLNPNLLKLTL